MALKFKVTKDEFDKLPAEIKAEYVEKDGEYVLDVSGAPSGDDAGALRRAKDREVQARKEAEARAKEAEDKLAEIGNDDARKRGDIETLEKAWKDKLDAEKSAREADKAKHRDFVTKLLVDNEATKIANEISTSPSLITPHIKARLSVDFDGDEPKAVILGTDGKPSRLTTDEFKKEFVDNKDFAPIIRASNASGGGAATDTSKTRFGSATHQSQDDKPLDLSKMNPKELAATIAARKAERAEAATE